jgi:hypothetical protein
MDIYICVYIHKSAKNKTPVIWHGKKTILVLYLEFGDLFASLFLEILATVSIRLSRERKSHKFFEEDH